jgi:hypothetical protein
MTGRACEKNGEGVGVCVHGHLYIAYVVNKVRALIIQSLFVVAIRSVATVSLKLGKRTCYWSVRDTTL